MVDFSLQGILNVINTAINAVEQAETFMDEMKDTGLVLDSDSQAQVDERIAVLEERYKRLFDRVQNKLRGT